MVGLKRTAFPITTMAPPGRNGRKPDGGIETRKDDLGVEREFRRNGRKPDGGIPAKMGRRGENQARGRSKAAQKARPEGKQGGFWQVSGA